MNSSGDLWYVKLPDGDVHRVTLDQLDEAFQGGHIDERTQVMAQSASRWMTLGQILGEDESVPHARSHGRAVPPPLPYGGAPQVPYSLRPMSVDFEDVSVVDLSPFKHRSGARWVFAALAIAAAVGGVSRVRPELRASALSQAESRIRSLAAGQWRAAVAASPGPIAAAPSPAVSTSPPEAAQPAPAPPPVAVPAVSPAGEPPAPQPASPSAPEAAAAPKRQPLTTKQRKPSAPSQAKSAGGSNKGLTSSKLKSQTFRTDGNKFDPLNSGI